MPELSPKESLENNKKTGNKRNTSVQPSLADWHTNNAISVRLKRKQSMLREKKNHLGDSNKGQSQQEGEEEDKS